MPPATTVDQNRVMDMATAFRLASAERVASLATIGVDGASHLVPCVFALHSDTVYTPVDAKPKRSRALQRLRNLERDPRAVLLVQHWDEDWNALWWVRLRGGGRVVTGPAELGVARGLLLDKYPQYRDPAELEPVIAVDVGSWHAWSASPPP